MQQNQKTEEFYKRLHEQLTNNTLWPAQYMFKFIVTADDAKVEQVKKVFENDNAQVAVKPSSKGNFVSISIQLKMKSPDTVIERYRGVSHVEGIISL